jgi:hypothetical protein
MVTKRRKGKGRGWHGDSQGHSDARFGKYKKKRPLSQKEIEQIQRRRSQRAKTMDNRKIAQTVYSKKDPDNRKWKKQPGQTDIEDVDEGYILSKKQKEEILEDMRSGSTKKRDEYFARKKRAQMKREEIKGGRADGVPDEMFKESQIRAGMEVEEEHTPDKSQQREIAKDHLIEADKDPDPYKVDSDYYSKKNGLLEMEERHEEEAEKERRRRAKMTRYDRFKEDYKKKNPDASSKEIWRAYNK